MPNERAKQFMPFNGLNGYFELLEEAEKYIIPKRELTEDEMNELNSIFPYIKKGDMVEVVYYDVDGYRIKNGIISHLDLEHHKIMVIKTWILFENLLKITLISPKKVREKPKN